ncbi:ATP-binding protein [Moorella sulfitireducens]|uniref:ATP-binding protein n=1 Tax=Neomoorella sulfitireducens TaxID=2972948 RepID=UPI0021AC53FF|nr:BTAD domain-containing putative transcriptional regulator [Moorella sulfitireducens]
MALAPEVYIDARLFEQGLALSRDDPEKLESILHYYQGDFLEGFTVSGCQEYYEWQAIERERYRQLALRGLTRLYELYEELGNINAALDTLERALAIEPLQEHLVCAAMRLLCLLGRRPQAIQKYHQLRKLLDDELGVPPMPQTQALYDAIITGKHPDAAGCYDQKCVDSLISKKKIEAPLRQRTSVLPFVGRHSELRVLNELFTKNKGRLVLIEGDPGIGKTRLVEEFINQNDALVISGTGREIEEGLPYHPFAEALRGLISLSEWPKLRALIQPRLATVWRSEIDRFFPEMALSTDISHVLKAAIDEYQLWEAINQLIIALAGYKPVIVFLDDLQWVDTSTLRLFSYLIRRSVGERVMFIGATRPLSYNRRLHVLTRGLRRDDLIIHLTLSPLTADDIAILAGQLSPAGAGALAEKLMLVSEGNPYILTELIRYMREKGLLSERGVADVGVLSLVQSIMPSSVESFVKDRIESISKEARRVLEAAAVVGREFEFGILVRALPFTEDVILEGLDELSSTGLVRMLEGMRYSFDHSLTREIVYGELGQARRQWLHRRIAEAMESTHRDRLETLADKLAWHFGHSDLPERGRRYALWAGNQAAHLGAYIESIRFFEQARESTDNTIRFHALCALAKALFAVRDTVRAADIYFQAATLAKYFGDAAHSEYLLGSAALSAAPHVGELIWGTIPMIQLPEMAEAIDHFKTAEALYARAQEAEPEIIVGIQLGLGLLETMQGNLPQAVGYYQAVLSTATRFDTQDTIEPRLISMLNLASHHHVLHQDKDKGLQYALSGLQLTQDEGVIKFQPFFLSVLGEYDLSMGNLNSAEEHLAAALELAERLSVPYAIVGITARLGRLSACRGQIEKARHQLLSALAEANAIEALHLATQIRLWLIPLLPPVEGRKLLDEVNAISPKTEVCSYQIKQFASPDFPCELKGLNL